MHCVCVCDCVAKRGGGLGAANSHWSGKSALDGRDVDNAVENKTSIFRCFFPLSRPPVPPVWPRSHAPLRLSRLRRVFDSRKCKINFIFPQAEGARIAAACICISTAYFPGMAAPPRLAHTSLLVSPDSHQCKKCITASVADCGNRNLPASFLSFLFLLVFFGH